MTINLILDEKLNSIIIIIMPLKQYTTFSILAIEKENTGSRP
jgi:hypothetical protein